MSLDSQTLPPELSPSNMTPALLPTQPARPMAGPGPTRAQRKKPANEATFQPVLKKLLERFLAGLLIVLLALAAGWFVADQMSMVNGL